MRNLGREALRDLLLLSLVAGSADAAGFLGVGHVFTSNMTGNLVLLGIAVGQFRWDEALKTSFVLLMFFLGAGLGSNFVRHLPDHDWRKLMVRILSVEALLLVLFASLWAIVSEKNHVIHFFWLIPFLAIAMGLQSAAMNRLMIAGVTNTAMTGTLTSLAVGCEKLFFKSSSREAGLHERLRNQTLVILFYCTGALGNGVLMLHAPWAIGFLPAILALVVAIGRFYRR